MNILKTVKGIMFSFAIAQTGFATEVETLKLDIVAYEDFAKGDPVALDVLRKALLEKGIAGIRGVPGYKENALRFIEKAKEFSELPMEIKIAYEPDRTAGDTWGYEIGKEKFQRADGSWIVDDSKASYYAFIPNAPFNKWPVECNLQSSFVNMADLMLTTGVNVLKAINLFGENCPVDLDKVFGVARMLHYNKQSDATIENPLWCGAHFDHGLFTVLMPAFYFSNGKQVPEPKEGGLFIRPTGGKKFYKVVSDDPEVVLFQVGEFGQLATNDSIKATEHRVHKALGGIERYTMALFLSPAMDTLIQSKSILTKDSRYGKQSSCSYQHWHEASLNRYLVKY